MTEPLTNEQQRAAPSGARPDAGAAKQCDLLCRARTTRRRKELTFTEITATDADGNVVAHAVHTYRIV
jgi:acyl-coenzyme A thioesterase PaaI-like protein